MRPLSLRLVTVRKPAGSAPVLPAGDVDEDTKLARAVIDDALAAMVAEAGHQLDVVLREVERAQQNVDRATADLHAWRRRRTFPHSAGVRVLLLAQVADMAETRLPPGVHLRAVTSYLAKDHPPAVDG